MKCSKCREKIELEEAGWINQKSYCSNCYGKSKEHSPRNICVKCGGAILLNKWFCRRYSGK